MIVARMAFTMTLVDIEFDFDFDGQLSGDCPWEFRPSFRLHIHNLASLKIHFISIWFDSVSFRSVLLFILISYHFHLYRCCFVLLFYLIAESGHTLYNTFRWNDCLHRWNGHQMWHIHCFVSLCCMFAIMFPIVGLSRYRMPMLADGCDDDDDDNNGAMVRYFHLIRVNRTASLLNLTSHLNLYPK